MKVLCAQGFRPLSGTYISQSRYSNNDYKAHVVSVPYRGLIFLNNIVNFRKDCKISFPSPIGDLYFSILMLILRIVTPQVSVPYRGLIFLNTLSCRHRLSFNVSVPYRGLIFLNTISAIPCKH